MQECTKCTFSRNYNKEKKACECPKEKFFTGSACIECYKPKYFDIEKLQCLSCPEKKIYSLDDKKCVSCPKENPWFNGIECATCPS